MGSPRRPRTRMTARSRILVLVAGSAACAVAAEGPPATPTGSYELEATVNGRAFPVRLELLSVEDRPWGRLTVAAGREVVVAVRGTEGTGGTWSFAVGGPVRDMRLRFQEDVAAGTITLGGGPPIPLQGRRAGDVGAPEGLRSHHVLAPLGLAARAGEEGASFPVVTPEGALIFTRHGPDLSRQTLMISEAGPDGWEDPRVMEMSGRHSDRSPALLPDGSGIVFASDRPAGDDDGEGYRLWFAPRAGPGEWGEPVRVEFEGGWDHDSRQPSVTTDGTLYFSSDAPGGSGEGDIHAAAPGASGRWGPPRNLGEPVNGPADEHGAFLAPDGSYMILASSGARQGQRGGDDLYLSLRTADGWSPPLALELPVNTFANEYGAWVSSLDHHLYFTSDRYGYAKIFRVDARAAGLPGGA